MDAQLSPGLAPWLRETFGLDVHHVRDLGMRDADDPQIFDAAREARVVVMTKDRDFVELLRRLGPPPQVLWITIGNTSMRHLKSVFTGSLPDALDLMRKGEPLVEIAETTRPAPPGGGT